MDLSIIIVNYNTIEFTKKCIESIYQETNNIIFEILLVDNNSISDDLAEITNNYPDIKVFKLKKNIGFAAGNNFASQKACGKYLLLLNPDTIILNQAITKLYQFAINTPTYGVFGGRSFYPDGTLNPSSCWGKPTLWSSLCSGIGLSSLFRKSVLFDPESLGKWQRDSIREVDIITGCFLMLKKELWDKLNGFDPAFFMYGEDADLCFRAKMINKKCIVNPNSRIIHYRESSERIKADKMVRLLTSEIHLIKKHWNRKAAKIGVFFIKLKPFSRMINFFILKTFSKKYSYNYKTWLQIWLRRKEWTSYQIDGK